MVKTILFGFLIAFLVVGVAWIFANIFCFVRVRYLIHKMKRDFKNLPVTTMCYGSMRISEDNVYQFGKTSLLTQRLSSSEDKP
ncbi:MAG: hypothetical protein E7612_06525 [Ruminococcaceae bacterium]|nr:hypothetical protein [Oscillospiraceae bacterium]